MPGRVYRLFLTLFTLGVIVQFFLAGLGVFRVHHVATKAGNVVTEKRFDHYFHAHTVLGNILFVVGVLVFVAALAARLGRTRVLIALALPLLVVLQSILANSGPTWFRALHPVVAVLILALAGSQTGRAWREHRA